MGLVSLYSLLLSLCSESRRGAARLLFPFSFTTLGFSLSQYDTLVAVKGNNAMRRVAVLVLTVTFSLALADRGLAGPFGVSMGMKPTDFNGLKKMSDPGWYSTTEISQPHSAFEEYALKFGSTTGLCRLTAVGKAMTTNDLGTDLQTAFNEMEKQLKDLYGENKRNDFLAEGSPLNKPEHFMMGLLRQDRVLTSSWEAKHGSTLKENLKAILLQAKALSTDKGYLLIVYEFQNVEECDQEPKAKDDAL